MTIHHVAYASFIPALRILRKTDTRTTTPKAAPSR